MADGTITYQVTVDNSGAIASIDRVGSSATAVAGESERASGGMLDAIKSKFVLTSDTILRAVDAAGKAVVQLVSSSVSAYGEFEQLAGGVGKIFGDMDTSVIMADAAEAYRTLNMSANDYLEIINSVGATFAQTMGDERGYNTAKQGLQAIADYASGTGKDVGLLSDKFTMITRSTSSYLSIADQFAGLLPQTTQGFLEQAQAAGFLDQSYTSLTQVPVDEYQAAIAAMLEKGVEEMGLLGNTAMETNETITGSIAAVKAQFENWLSALADGNADTAEQTQVLADTVMAMAANVVPAIINILLTLPPALLDIIAQLVSYVIEHAPEMLAAAVQFFIQLASGIVNALPSILVSLVGAIASLIAKVFDPSFHAQMREAGMNLIEGLWSGIQDAIGRAIARIPQAFGSLIDGVKNFFGIASPSKRFRYEIGRQLPAGAEQGIYDGLPALRRARDAMSAAMYGGTYGSIYNTTNLTIGSMALTSPQSVAAAGSLAESVRMDLRMAGV